MQSQEVCFPQVSLLRQSETVVTGLVKPEVVVTMQVTSLRSSSPAEAVVYGPSAAMGMTSIPSGRRVA